MQSLEQRRPTWGDVGGEAGAEVRREPPRFRDTPMEVKAYSTAGMAGWAAQLGSPAPEAPRSRRMARTGGIAAIAALLLYLAWRIAFTMPLGGGDLVIAWTLVTFEALPLTGLVLKSITLWNIDCYAPEPVAEAPNGMKVAVLIPTYNEPVEVLAPTIAAACALEPSHETWVLDDGSRTWAAEMCASFGARVVTRTEHDHAKAGNMNHALELMAAEETAGKDAIDIIAVLDCDHVPLPTFLTATWAGSPTRKQQFPWISSGSGRVRRESTLLRCGVVNGTGKRIAGSHSGCSIPPMMSCPAFPLGSLPSQPASRHERPHLA